MTDKHSALALAELRNHSFLTEKGRRLARRATSMHGLIESLLHWKLHSDATYAIACWMPAPLGVWWGCVSIDYVEHETRPRFQPHPEVLARIVAWVVDPDERNRLAVREAGRGVRYANPHGALTKAAGWGLDFGLGKYFGPDPFATHRAVGFAVKTCGGHDCLPGLLSIGLKMLHGEYAWKTGGEVRT